MAINIKYLEELCEDTVRTEFSRILNRTNRPLHNSFKLRPHRVRISVSSNRPYHLWEGFVASTTNTYACDILSVLLHFLRHLVNTFTLQCFSLFTIHIPSYNKFHAQ